MTPIPQGFHSTTLRDLIELVKLMRKAQRSERRAKAYYRRAVYYDEAIKLEEAVDTWIRKYDWVGTGKIKREKK